jgi:NADPH2:quinone reductase
VPHLDGAGVVDAVGEGVDTVLVGDRVWVWLVAYLRLEGTAQEFAIVPTTLVQQLPDSASFELGASLGVPFITAHRALTLHEHGPSRLSRGALTGTSILVAGGAGAVGNAAIQLGKWAGAEVITTVSSPQKRGLAHAAGADHVIDYTSQDVVAEVRRIRPDGVSTVVEVSPAVNCDIDNAVSATHGVVAVYGNDRGDRMTLPVRSLMTLNINWRFMLLYTMPDRAHRDAVESIGSALTQGAIGVGSDVGLPLHHFPLEQAADAHRAVEGGAIGKVLLSL